MKTTFIAASAFVCNAFALAGTEFVIDGSAEKGYGSAVSVQGITTAFGNHIGSAPGRCEGSELDVAYGVVVGDAATGYLHLVLAGNLQTNFNKLDVFVDARAGAGQNSLRSDNPQISFNQLNTSLGASADGSVPGLTFDAGFDADAVFFFTVGGGAPNTMYVDYAPLASAGGGQGAYIGQGNYDNVLAAHVMPPRPIGAGGLMSAALNNTNVVGVTADPAGQPASGGGVTTGLEVKIPLAAVNWDGVSPIKVCAFVANGNHSSLSNQVLGGLPVGSTDLGNRPNLASIAGNQYFTVPVASAPVNIVVDGDAEPAYGAPLAVQGITTSFGDHVGAPPPAGDCYGSELDAAYAAIVGDAATGHLHLVLAGNLQTNFNKLDVFFDARPGAGQNSLRSDNPQISFNQLNDNLGASLDGSQAGLTFDQGFDADAVLFFGVGNSAPNTMYVDYAQILNAGGGVGGYVGPGNFDTTLVAHVLPPTAMPGIGLPLEAALNNTNIAGVDGGIDGQASSGAGVVTGLEIKVPLAAIDWDGVSPIKVCAFVASDNHSFLSNQVLGGLPVGSTNLGGRPNFANIAGDQFFVVTPGTTDTCPADLTDDGFVDGNDLGVLLGAWGDCPASGACPADLNDDAFVDGNDLGLLLAAWGTCPS
jgi:hypothetical protein